MLIQRIVNERGKIAMIEMRQVEKMRKRTFC